MHVELTPATQADLPRLCEWMRQLRVVDPMASAGFVPMNLSHAAIEQLLGDESLGRVCIIRADLHEVGYVALVFSFSIEFGGRTAFVDELFIEENVRGKGIGRRVVALVTELARSLGVGNLLLEVTESNAAARRLYESAGFIQRGYHLMSKWLKEEP